MREQPQSGANLTTATRPAIPARRIAAATLIVLGAALLILCAKAIDLGIAPPQGPSTAQVWLGVAGTLVTATGIALAIQPFTPSESRPQR